MKRRDLIAGVVVVVLLGVTLGYVGWNLSNEPDSQPEQETASLEPPSSEVKQQQEEEPVEADPESPIQKLLRDFQSTPPAAESEHIEFVSNASQVLFNRAVMSSATDDEVLQLVEALIPSLENLLGYDDVDIRLEAASVTLRLSQEYIDTESYPLEPLVPSIVAGVQKDPNSTIRSVLVSSLYGYVALDEKIVTDLLSQIRRDPAIQMRGLTTIASIASLTRRNEAARQGMLALIEEEDDLSWVITAIDSRTDIHPTILDSLVAHFVTGSPSPKEWDHFAVFLLSRPGAIADYPALQDELTRLMRDPKAPEVARSTAVALVSESEALQGDDAFDAVRDIADNSVEAEADLVQLAQRVLELVAQ